MRQSPRYTIAIADGGLLLGLCAGAGDRMNATPLYFTDNGRVLCARHLGTSAATTGRDISGQRIEPVQDADRADWLNTVGSPIVCESCNRVATVAV